MTSQSRAPRATYSTALVGDFAHEVSGSTHAVLGYAGLLEELLAESAAPETQAMRSMVESLSVAARRLGTIAEAVSWTTTQADRPVAVEEIDLAQALADTKTRWEGPLGTRKIEVEVLLGGGKIVLAARTGLDGLLDLLLANAISHSPRGSTVSISTETAPTAVNLHVDTPNQGTLDRFERHLIAHLSNQAGLGVSFEPTAEHQRVTLRAPLPGASVEQVNDRTVVLHIDDDGATRDLVTAVLSIQGWEVVSIASIEPARRMLDACQPDVLIIDQRLGDQRGTDFIRAIRNEWSSLPVVMLSADQDEALAADAVELGALLVHKPVSNESLVASVQTALNVYL